MVLELAGEFFVEGCLSIIPNILVNENEGKGMSVTFIRKKGQKILKETHTVTEDLWSLRHDNFGSVGGYP